MKNILLTFILPVILSFSTYARDLEINSELECLKVLETQVLGIEEYEINFNSTDCTQQQIVSDLKTTLAVLFNTAEPTEDALDIVKADISQVLETLSKKHPASAAFPLVDVKLIEEFWTGLESDPLKQSGNFTTSTEDKKSSYYLLLMYTKELNQLVLIYKPISESITDQPDC